MKPEDLNPPQMSEMLAGFADHARFSREALVIRDLGGSAIPMELSPGQLKLHALKRKLQKQGKPVRIVALKPRRAWFTAGSCAEMFHDVPFWPGRKGLIIADKYKPAALEAFGYLLQFQRGYKPFGLHGASIKLPKLVKDTENQLNWENGSQIDVLSAEAGDVGRGGGRHWLLADEMAFWRAPEVTLTATLNMIPKLPDTCVVVQSTANGVGGEFYELWQRATDPARASGWTPLFFSSIEHPAYRVRPEDPAGFMNSLDPEERMLHEMRNAPMDWLNWRRLTIATECRGKVDLFHQEYPTTPEEAFLSSGRPALDVQALSRMPVMDGTVGELKLEEGFPRDRVIFKPSAYGALTLWKRAEPGRAYVIGADPSKGKDVSEGKRGDDPDWSVAIVLDRDTGEQVAQLRERIRPAQFAEYLALLGRVYNYAYLVPESNDAGFIDALLRTNYPLECIFDRRRDPTDRRSGRPQDIGFETTAVTRPWLISAIDDAVRTMAVAVRSAITVQECRTFVIKPDGKAEHQTGCHDDCVLALALAVMGLRYAPKRAPGKTAAARGIQRYGEARKRDEDDD